MAKVDLNAPVKVILAELMRLPHLALLQREINAVLDQEGQLRQRFYGTVRDDQKIEFINGEAIEQLPSTFRHDQVIDNLRLLSGTYVQVRSCGWTGGNKIMIALTRNAYQPDICFFAREKAAAFEPQQELFPTPDMVAEVLAPGTTDMDRGVKFADYAAHGVAEYWIVDPDAEKVEQYLLQDEQYELEIKARTGTITSIAVPGFEIPIRAIFDQTENLAALRTILTSN
jgi:Uma2 family endonuclease